MKNKALIAFGLSLAALSFADGWSLDLNSGVKSVDFKRDTIYTEASEKKVATPFGIDKDAIQVPLGLDLKFSQNGINWGLHADNGNAAISDYKDFSNKVGEKLNAQTNFDATLGDKALKGYLEGKLVLLNAGNSDDKNQFGKAAGDLSLKIGPKYMSGNHLFTLLGVYKSNKLVTPQEAGVESSYTYKGGLLGLSGSVMYQFGNEDYNVYFKNDAKATVSYDNEAGTVNYAPSLEVKYNVATKKDDATKMMNQVIPSAELLGLTLKGKYVTVELKDKVEFNYYNNQVIAAPTEQLGIKNDAKLALGLSGKVGKVTLSSKLTGEAKTAADLKKGADGFALENARTADGDKTYKLDISKVDAAKRLDATNNKQNVLTLLTGKLENSLEYNYNSIVDLKLEANLATDASLQTYVGKKVDADKEKEKAINTWNGLTTTFKGTLTVSPVSAFKFTVGAGVDLVTKFVGEQFGLTNIKPSATLGVTFSW